jgi:hypothetical protein
MRRCLERRKWERGCGWWPRRRCGAGFMVRTALPWWLDFAGFVCYVHHQKRLNGAQYSRVLYSTKRHAKCGCICGQFRQN